MMSTDESQIAMHNPGLMHGAGFPAKPNKRMLYGNLGMENTLDGVLCQKKKRSSYLGRAPTRRGNGWGKIRVRQQGHVEL